MQLGWMRVSQEHTPRLSQAALSDAVAQSDELGLSHFHALSTDDLGTVALTKGVNIVVDFATLVPKPPRAMVEIIRAVQERLDGRLVLSLRTNQSPQSRTATQTFETFLSGTDSLPLPSDFPMKPPRPEVLLMPQAGGIHDFSAAAANGFHALSPASQSGRDLGRHWPAIVAGATHAARRACPSHWHFARCVFVSDNQAAVDAYRSGPALSYLRRCLPPEADVELLAKDCIIVGSASDVAEQLATLRTRIGPFGTLHCVDPGLDPDEAMRQRKIIAAHVLPALGPTTPAFKRELERI